jgi:hypothetical protein
LPRLQHAQAGGGEVSPLSWAETTIAPDGTHHRSSAGEPFYAVRFTRVLKYHDPGLAPVVDRSGAYHVDVYGREVYPERYLQTFGFYGNRAAVASGEGWFHIDTEGRRLSETCFAWCGNFQEGRCAVRRRDERYVHVASDDRAAYAADWRYAGDFRDGVAVVQRSDGMHIHIDRHGAPIHERAFLDLDVFHKGLARARDGGGWHHVGHAGRPAYPRRFASVEPFYNGQSRVEADGGGLEIIDEQGVTLLVLRTPGTSRRPSE